MVRAAAVAALLALAPRAWGQAAAPAAASPAPGPSTPAPAAALPDPRTEAAARFGEGRYAEAFDLYRQALRQSGDPSLYFELGECHERLNEPAEAAASYRVFLARAPDDPRAPRAREQLSHLLKASHTSRTLLLTLSGGAVMSAAAGAFFGARSRSERNALHREVHVSYDVTQRENVMVDDAHRANLLFVLSGALAAAAAGLFVLDF